MKNVFISLLLAALLVSVVFAAAYTALSVMNQSFGEKFSSGISLLNFIPEIIVGVVLFKVAYSSILRKRRKDDAKKCKASK